MLYHAPGEETLKANLCTNRPNKQTLRIICTEQLNVQSTAGSQVERREQTFIITLQINYIKLIHEAPLIKLHSKYCETG